MDIDTLKESLSQYELQLKQVETALEGGGDDCESLTSLKLDLKELIELTKENLDRLCPRGDVKTESGAVKPELDDEYALFMAEMSETGAYEDKTEQTSKTNIEDELSSLLGKRCSVSFGHKTGGATSVCNAMISSIERDSINSTMNYDDIQVRLMFTNPTHIEMVPCPYYLDSSCKFTDDTCRYSHGEIMQLSMLKDSIEPEFASLKTGSRVLANIKQDESASSSKISDKYLLWHRAVVTNIAHDEHTCHVKLEHDILSKGKRDNIYEVDFGYIFPLTDDYYDSDGDSDSSDDLEQQSCFNDDFDRFLVEKSLEGTPTTKLGEWEKHTKGIGSKLMMKMGYITGTGLGPQGDGIIQPIPCRITPAGRSLDHCMDLRELADDPIKAEKKLERLKKKEEERNKKAYERAKAKEEHNVFNILNKTLGDQPPKEIKKESDTVREIKATSCKNLNIEQFKLSEDIRKLEKDIAKLKGSILRNNSNAEIKKSLTLQLNGKLNKMNELKSQESRISNEQNSRKDKKKMSIF